MRWWLWLSRRLHERGVLGLNARSARYMLLCNDRRNFPLVDDKLRTKRLFLEHGVPVPPLYFVIHSPGEVRRLDERLADHRSFVIKPARGSGGRGVLVITDRQPAGWVTATGTVLSGEDVRYYVDDILSGLYSLSGLADHALVEYRVECDPVFAPVSFRGVPDIRIIVYRKYPVMAMLRLPTRRSGGRANLHQGAIGAGMDLAGGRTVHAVDGTCPIVKHPDTGESVIGLAVPRWNDMLLIATRIADLVPLGYIGVDIVLDAQHGPMVLELNARPGLAIQMANDAGLQTRLEWIDHVTETEPDALDRVRQAQTWFGSIPAPEPAPMVARVVKQIA
jgi:alpha-L-glutamate ligase-like protein